MVKSAPGLIDTGRPEAGQPVVVIFVCGNCARVYRALQRPWLIRRQDGLSAEVAALPSTNGRAAMITRPGVAGLSQSDAVE